MKEGEYVCYECNGSGKIDEPLIYDCLIKCEVRCPICKGTGKLDWISNIIKPQNNSKLEVDIIAKPIKPIEMIELDFVIDKEGIVKNRTKKE